MYANIAGGAAFVAVTLLCILYIAKHAEDRRVSIAILLAITLPLGAGVLLDLPSARAAGIGAMCGVFAGLFIMGLWYTRRR